MYLSISSLACATASTLRLNTAAVGSQKLLCTFTLKPGLVEHGAGGGVLCPFAEIHIDMRLHAPQPLVA